jgi:hypothetical protein
MPQVTSGSKGHRIARTGHDEYSISWTIDRKYKGSRLRFPRGYSRLTNEKGARAFAKKHGCAFPEVPQTASERIRAIHGLLRFREDGGYGRSTFGIAQILGLSEKCVKDHLTRMRANGQAGYSPRGWYRIEKT